MDHTRRHFRLGLWLALAAMLALALAPTLSHAFARAAGVAGNGYAEVCTPQGMKWVALADGEQQPASAALHLEHCPYCTGAAAAVGLPAAPPALPLPDARAGYEAPAFLHAPRPLHAWTAAQPRAPPTFS